MPKLKFDQIVVKAGRRPLVKDAVKSIAESMATPSIGQLQPILVRPADKDGKHVLIAGLHRIAAAKANGWSEIDAKVLEGADADAAEIAEIDENLQRAELTELQRAQQLQRRKEIFEARAAGAEKSPASLKDGRKAGPQHKKGFDQKTADATGMDKSTVRKSRVRAVKIAKDVQDAIDGTDIAKSGVELDELSKLKPAQQRKAVDKVKSGKAKTVREALGKAKPKAPATPLAKLKAAWEKTPAPGRKAFVAFLRKSAPDLLGEAPKAEPKAAAKAKAPAKPKAEAKPAKAKTAEAKKPEPAKADKPTPAAKPVASGAGDMPGFLRRNKEAKDAATAKTAKKTGAKPATK